MQIGYEVRESPDGKGDGVFATRAYARGETVLEGVQGQPVAANDIWANQAGRASWIREGGVHEKLNHSCDPTCGVRQQADGAVDYVARRDIEPGEEITFDYAMRNWVVEHASSRCRCGTESCRGTITGWRDLPAERRAAYQGMVARYLLEMDGGSAAPPRA